MGKHEHFRVDEGLGVALEHSNRGIVMLSGGHIAEAYERIAALITPPGKWIPMRQFRATPMPSR